MYNIYKLQLFNQYLHSTIQFLQETQNKYYSYVIERVRDRVALRNEFITCESSNSYRANNYMSVK